MPFAFDNTYARLPERFHARVAPTPVRAPRVLAVDGALAGLLGIAVERLASAEGAAILGGNALPEGAEPIALAYAGHQFGHFVPQLGDGRAILLGEVIGTDGRRRDLQLKGAGRTPFSRGGDGRAAIGPVLREYVVSAAMAAFGIPTTRSLAAVATGEPVVRERVLPGAVLTRVAASHLRVGTFEYFAVRGDREAIAILVRHALERHYPDALVDGSSTGDLSLALLDRVIEAQASLIARWLGVGFVHGVMNTDNCTISGETIDYGPCAFLDEFDRRKKFSSIDHGGRYAFGNQPKIALWNCARLAETLLPAIDDDVDEAARRATERLDRFAGLFEGAYAKVLRDKLGLARTEQGDPALVEDLHRRLEEQQVDYTIFFRRLAEVVDGPRPLQQLEAVEALFRDPGAFHGWAEGYRARLSREQRSPAEQAAAMRHHNPAFIPRNHRIEEAIVAAEERDDLRPFERLVEVVRRPYDDQPAHAELADPPRAEERVTRTFCGT
jgi:uncharacterized protein YdiU (UPF0061 family)